MSWFRKLSLILIGLFAVAPLHPRSAFACAVCYGASDAPMAQGMNYGILSLLIMIVLVLGGVASFFVFLARRSASLPELPTDTELADSTPQA